MKTKQINYRLLRRIRDEILKRPKQFELSSWFSKEPSVPMCGTTACIAGWAVTIDECGHKKLSPLVGAKSIYPGFGRADHDSLFGSVADTMNRRGRQILGLNGDEAQRLFNLSGWPKEFREDYGFLFSKRLEARVAAKRIDFFIQTKGTDVAAKR